MPSQSIVGWQWACWLGAADVQAVTSSLHETMQRLHILLILPNFTIYVCMRRAMHNFLTGHVCGGIAAGGCHRTSSTARRPARRGQAGAGGPLQPLRVGPYLEHRDDRLHHGHHHRHHWAVDRPSISSLSSRWASALHAVALVTCGLVLWMLPASIWFVDQGIGIHTWI
jgi:hypothetical protein